MTTEQAHKLAAHLLNMAADQFSNHGCNDFDLSEVFPEAQAVQISDDIARGCGWSEEDIRHDSYTVDWLAMRTVAEILAPKGDAER